MEFKNDWAEAVRSEEDGYSFHTLELALEFYDCQPQEEVPELLQCLKYETPTFDACDLVDSLIEQLNDNYRNDDGHISDSIEDKLQVALVDAFQPLIDKLLLDCGWKTYAPTEHLIHLVPVLQAWREARDLKAAGVNQLKLITT